MNKKDIIPIILLVLLIPIWTFIDRIFIAPKFPAEPPAQPVAIAEETASQPEKPAAALEPIEIAAPSEEEAPPVEEVVTLLNNGRIELELTSRGGGIRSAVLLSYPELNEEESPPVVLDFADAPALVYEGLPGIGVNDMVSITTDEAAHTATITKTLPSGIRFERIITATNGYLLAIQDRFTNPNDLPLAWQEPQMATGPMRNPADTKAAKGMSILGVDSYTPDGGINYWGRKLNSFFDPRGFWSKMSKKPYDIPLSIDHIPLEMREVTVDWVSAKNKFFTQILHPTQPVGTFSIRSDRDPDEKAAVPMSVAAVLDFNPITIPAGESVTLSYNYYIGPKKYTILKDAGYAMEKVMEFETTGFWSFLNWLMEPARKFLLLTMNLFNRIIPGGYGVAIILLTLLIRILFWPLTHKSTESMKRMQEIQPELKALQAKYGKTNPQKLQQETMKLYKEKKVNPMGGCLPMFIQIPVFIALFTVLRNAIELRFSGFLWIADLSTPENLFPGQVPFVGSLNILPIVMSISMIWQQKLTSPGTAATPEQQQQQKMMMFMMPVMMLFFFYSMPSGLVLYWTTSNLLMIAQTSMRNLKKKRSEA